MKLSLRARLTLWYNAVVLIALFIFGTFGYLYLSSKLIQNLDESLCQIALSVESAILQSGDNLKQMHIRSAPCFIIYNETALRQLKDSSTFTKNNIEADTFGNSYDTLPDYRVWSSIFEPLSFEPENCYVQINDKNGKILWKSSNFNRDSIPLFKYAEDRFLKPDDKIPVKNNHCRKSAYFNFTLGEKNLRSIALQSSFGYVSVGIPMDRIYSTLDSLLTYFLISIPFVLLISTAGGLALSKLTLGKIDKITATVKEIRAKNMSRRLPKYKADDEIARLSDTINEMLDRIENSFEQTRRFTADASHELRTPLTILRGELEIALRREKTPQEYQELIASALDEVIRLSKMVETLLDLSKADTGNIKLTLEKKNISILMRDIADDVIFLAEVKNISVKTDIQENINSMADIGRLHQAVLNIIDNAVKYTPEGGEIFIGLKKTSKNIEISVKDNGMGIFEEKLNKIFERFYRIDEARFINEKGSGLGLSIVKWIVSAHNGKIDISSTPGKGTTFKILLPAYNDLSEKLS